MMCGKAFFILLFNGLFIGNCFGMSENYPIFTTTGKDIFTLFSSVTEDQRYILHCLTTKKSITITEKVLRQMKELGNNEQVRAILTGFSMRDHVIPARCHVPFDELKRSFKNSIDFPSIAVACAALISNTLYARVFFVRLFFDCSVIMAIFFGPVAVTLYCTIPGGTELIRRYFDRTRDYMNKHIGGCFFALVSGLGYCYGPRLIKDKEIMEYIGFTMLAYHMLSILMVIPKCSYEWYTNRSTTFGEFFDEDI